MKHQRGEEHWNGKAAVVVEYAGGGRETVTFDTRIEAEQWLSLLPWRQAAGDEEVSDIRSAMLAETAVVRPEDVVAALSWN